MLGSVTLDLDPVDRGRSTVGGLGPRRLVLTMGCRNLSEDPVSSSGLCPLSLSCSMPRGTQVPYSAVVDLAEGYGVSHVVSEPGPHSPGHKTEAMPESSSHRQTNAASHEIIGNFMTKMTELLEATLTNRRGEGDQNASNDEALERFLRFRPPEFHGEVGQEAKAELVLEQLNDIYDTCSMKAPGGLRVDLQHALAPLPPTSFAATVEAATRTEIANQVTKQRTMALNASFHPHKRSGQGRWRPQYPKKPRNSNQTGNGNR
ncbi:hypothetical protein M9H77_16264 [Catharanthus roseus]|uniref:Uncharacterized protein n=1 Tax=Catharanthus roseus TaxID=4058 RepID=A0ACC0B0B5_CATRO|nr:hypothetical protein M9H77_16264 [Catharanthus roseus]